MRSYATQRSALVLCLFAAACATKEEARSPAPRPSGPPPRAAATVSSPAFTGQRAFDFESVSPGELPPHWRIGATNAGAEFALWSTVGSPAHGGRQALALTDPRGGTGQTYNLCWTDELLFLNGSVEVAVHAGGGEEDQGGGPAWRIRGSNDYYLARWNPLENNFRVYAVANGERKTIDSAEVRADPEAWHTISIRHEGALIVCSFDGKELLRASDTTHLAPGGVGMWTKADAATVFDDLVVKGP